MSFTTLTTQVDGAVMTVTLSNGEANVMSAVMAAEIFAVVGQLAVNPAIKVAIFDSSTPDFFVSHFDLGDIFKSLSGDPSMPTSKFADINILQSLSLSIQALPQITIAKVNGACRAGGAEFMLAMDMVFASEQSRFGFPEANLGFLAAGGGATFLPLRIGKNRALEVLLTGRDFSATEAVSYGFVNCALADSTALDSYVADAAARIASNNIAAIAALKATVKKTTAGFVDGVMAGLAQENASMITCLSDPAVLQKLQALAAVAGTRDAELDLPATIDAL